MTDLYTSIVRTVVPALVGLVLGLGAAAGLDLDSAQVTAALTVGVYLAYYSVLRTVETWATTRGITWLATVAGVMLGWAASPTYEAPEEARIELRVDTAAADREIRAALDRAYGRRAGS